MSTTLLAFRNKLNLLIDIPVTGTTDSTGTTTTIVDSELAKYDKIDYFEGWEAYVALTTPEAQTVDTFLPASGTLTVYSVYGEAVADKTVYTLCRFPMANKLSAINRSLNAAYPLFFAREISKTLWGQNAYGVDPNEFNKFTYTVPSEFVEFPTEIWLTSAYAGEHSGADDAAILTDSSRSWKVSELIGLTLYNKTDGSSTTVTSNTATTITGTLAGGTDNDWDEDDEYIIAKPSVAPERLTNFRVLPSGEDAWDFYASIPEDTLITLIGKGRLTAFTTETSTTELTDSQADIVALKAAAIFYEFYVGSVNSQDSERFDALSNKFHGMYEYEAARLSKPDMKKMKLDWGFL